MNLRLFCAVLLAVGCCLIVPDDCAAQRHPARSRKALATPPLPPSVRLVQAHDEDLDDVLGTAKDLLDELDTASDSTFELDLDESPQPAATGSDGPKLPRTLDEYRRDGQQAGQLQGVSDEDGLDLDGLDLDELTPEADDQADETVNSRFQDVQPRPVRRRPRPNTPYSLGDILGDEDETDRCCEQEFCNRMWACAGGRCQSWFQRYNRDLDRQKLLRNSCNNPDCLKSPFSEPFVCPKRQQTPYGSAGFAHQDGQSQDGLHQAGPYRVISDRACPPGNSPASDENYELTFDEVPGGLQNEGDVLDLAPNSDSTSRRPKQTRPQ